MFPSYHVEVLDMTCMMVIDKIGTGFVAINAKVSGISSGVTRAFVMHFDFSKDENSWKAITFSSMGGQDLSGWNGKSHYVA
ncbi:hypothetical protein Slin14017_G111660 [Septoria linicola]|nr:hypothetical protein Slin14017_G111660 [Septoria linicola]